MKLILVLLALFQEPHVHGGFAACESAADWLAQERLVDAGDVAAWNDFMRVHPGCVLTIDGAAYEIRPSETPGTVMLRRRTELKQAEPEPWRVVSLAAVETK